MFNFFIIYSSKKFSMTSFDGKYPLATTLLLMSKVGNTQVGYRSNSFVSLMI